MKIRSIATVGFVSIAGIAMVANAAQRRVMFEQHTASWCGPCINTGLALADLTDENPNSFQSIQMHIWDSSYGFDEPHCESRASFYGVSGIPHTAVDGVWRKSGTSGEAGDYSQFQAILNQRLNVPTDLQIDLVGEPTGGSNYTVTMTLTADSNAPTRTMVVHCHMTVDADSCYPNCSQAHYYDTHFDHMPTQTITLSAGQSQVIDHTFVLNSTASSNTDHVTFTCFAQEPGTNGSSLTLDVLNMNFMDYSIRPPETITIPNSQHPTIQSAIDNSVSGDTIIVNPGTYNETLVFNGSNCTLVSAEGPESTVIDAGGNGTVLTMLNSGSGTVDGFTIKNGLNTIGSAVKLNGNPKIKNCIIRDNTSTSNYVIFSTGNPVISDTLFCNNSTNNIALNWTNGGGVEFADVCPNEPCPGDLDSDGAIGVNDVLALISAYGTPDGDVDGNGTTDVNDILFVIGIFGQSC